MDTISNNRRIAKNTLILYFRMIIVTVVSFYTVRITLQVLGAEDYGIQNVVAGLVSFLHIITASVGSANQRFLAFELGRNDVDRFQKVFSILMNIYFVLSAIVLVVGEIVGPWFINTYLVIPPERLSAAHWAYQCSIISFVISMTMAPYMSSIIAYEKMNIYAYVSLYDVAVKLIVVYLLYISTFDKLITISVLTLLAQFSVLVIYVVYCQFRLPGCRYRKYWDKQTFQHIMGYTGWNLFGSVSGTLATSGMTVLLNMFFGPVVNAAKAIADKIYGIVFSFSTNFYQAVAPQIIKTYASGDLEYSRQLVYRSSKFSFYLLFAIALPVITLANDFLTFWLGKESMTSDMVLFSKWMMVYALVYVFEQPITMIIRATGNIKKYQVYVGTLTLLAVPVAYLCFKLGFSAIFSVFSLIVVYGVALGLRLYIAKEAVGLNYRDYFHFVFLPIIKVLPIPIIAAVALKSISTDSIIKVLLLSVIIVLVVLTNIYFFGLSEGEKVLIRERVNSIIKRNVFK